MKKNETITITRETYELINTYVDLLNKISDAYIMNDATEDTEMAHLSLARWAASAKIKEAIDGDVKDLKESVESATDSLSMLSMLNELHY